MLHIILLILKTIGIILGLILGILLTIILLVLLVPIRYQVEAEKTDDIRARGKVSWLFRLLYVKIQYVDNNLKIVLRVLGYPVFDTDRTVDEEKKAKQKQRKNSKKANRLVKKNRKSKEKSAKEKRLKEKRLESDEQESRDNKLDSNQQGAGLSTGFSLEKDREKSYGISKLPNNGIDNEEKTIPEKNTNQIKEQIKKTEQPDKEMNDKALPAETTHIGESKEDYSKKKINLIQRIKNIWGKIKGFFRKIGNTIKNIKNSFHNIEHMIRKIRNFLEDEKNKNGIKLAFGSIKKILRHILPHKYYLEAKFGTGDPCSTGQILAGVALIYPIIGEHISVIPDFENEVLEGKLNAKGRIRLISLLIICIKLILNEHCRYLFHSIQNFKEEL